jgi:Putative auto-transporter adhesin, head GIN domain
MAGFTIEGSGVLASEPRDVSPFTGVSLLGQGRVQVEIGEPQSITVHTDDNLLEHVLTEVEDGTLEIRQSDDTSIEPRAGLTIEIRVPTLEAASVGGAGSITVGGLQVAAFTATVSGSGDIEASGTATRVLAEVSGSGDLRLDRLAAREVDADISGAGSIDVDAADSLHASVSGAGRIRYSGDPPQVETDVSGAGRIKAR